MYRYRYIDIYILHDLELCRSLYRYLIYNYLKILSTLETILAESKVKRRNPFVFLNHLNIDIYSI